MRWQFHFCAFHRVKCYILVESFCEGVSSSLSCSIFAQHEISPTTLEGGDVVVVVFRVYELLVSLWLCAGEAYHGGLPDAGMSSACS